MNELVQHLSDEYVEEPEECSSVIAQQVLDEFKNMTDEEYISLLDSIRGYLSHEIPTSDFKRILTISSCNECPNLYNRGEYMVSEKHVCDKTKQSTSEYRNVMPKKVALELYEMFEKCTYLKKEVK